MSLTRQLLLIVMPPLFFMVLHAVYGTVVGWGGVSSTVFITLAMAGTSMGLAYLLARPLIRKTLAIVKVSNSLVDGADATNAVSNSLDVDAVLKTLKLVKTNQGAMTEQLNENSAKFDALDRSQAAIEFDLDGIILTANDNFLNTLGYTLEDIQGKHHRIFVDAEYEQSPAYKSFWDNLNRGEYQAGEFKRIGKGGNEVWIQASYNPIFDLKGKPVKVVKYAADITETVKASNEALFKSSAFAGSSVAIMMVDRDLLVTHVNTATKKLLGDNQEAFREVWPTFTAADIVGSCIDMFHKNPAHQRQLLSDPSRLPFSTDIAIGDLRINLNVSGIFNAEGEYVGSSLEWADVTASRLNTGKLDALDRSQAVIEFNLDGTIQSANENFLNTLGYRPEEISGKHHSMFVDSEYSASAEYRTFWDGLKRGEYQAGEFKRVGKGGKDVWIQASYNPILDGNGKPFKVVKFASDITEEHNQRLKNEAEQQAQADVQSLVVSSLADGLQKLAMGDLENRIDAQFSPEYEKLRTDFNEAVSKLQDTISVIISTAEGIRQGSGEISTATDDLSKRTENQAATLEQTAAALDEITATVKQSAENAKEANEVAGKAQLEAKQSGEVVSETVTAMSEIEKSAHQISQIIGVIDDIAFQTNLLALNAGVEAARAGDAGRGFAVVAQEVRALAQRSSDAAKEIKGLITTSSQHVESGVELVGKAGSALEKIVDRVEAINGLVSDIAVSAKEQADSLSEANTAVNNMDQVTQQNASMVEETTAASRTLSGDANELMRQVAHFKIGGDRASGASSVASHGSAGGQNVVTQQRRAASFASDGSAALQTSFEDKSEEWEDF